MKKTIGVLTTVFLLSPGAEALEGLQGLQKAALSDQHTECMIHEYTRRYNEVLRDFSKKKKKWGSELDMQAHTEAMKWVNDVWKFADPGVVQQNLQSEEFLSAVEQFRAGQKLQYPNLAVVH